MPDSRLKQAKYILNNDPYQLKRTAKCISCGDFVYICAHCGYIHTRASISDMLFHMPKVPYTSRTIALCKLSYPDLGQALRYE